MILNTGYYLQKPADRVKYLQFIFVLKKRVCGFGFRGRSPLNKLHKEELHMKKMVALVLALILALSCTAVFAEAKSE